MQLLIFLNAYISRGFIYLVDHVAVRSTVMIVSNRELSRRIPVYDINASDTGGA